MRECPICKSCFPDDVNHCPNDGESTTQSIQGEPVLDGRYLLEKRLGQGGMGVVFKARHVFLKTQHAIKVILPDLVGNDPMLVTRFRQEALAAAAIRHQNIIAVTDFGVARGTMPFLVMEFIGGESLHDVLMREKALSPEKALEVMYAIGAGVSAAHRQGIVHRDLKPLNIMFQEGLPTNEAIKILDFGLAKIKSGELLGSFVQAQTTGLMGSPYYMAPEQWADEEPDSQADVYSLGIMLFQMLTGDVPFKGNSFPAIMKKHVSELPPRFADVGVHVPHQVEAAVRHALEKDKANRTKTVEDFIAELKLALSAATSNLNQTVVDVAHSTDPTLTQKTGDVGTEKLPTGTVYFQTNPSQANIFVDNRFVGSSDPLGVIVVEGVSLGVHRVRVSHDGYQDWEREVNFQSVPIRTNVTLKSMLATNVMTPAEKEVIDKPDIGSQTVGQSGQNISGYDTNLGNPKASGATNALQQGVGTRPLEDIAPVLGTQALNQTVNANANENWQQTNPAMHTTMPAPASSSMPIILSAAALGIVFLFVGVFAVYKIFIEKAPVVINNNGNPTPTPTPVPIKGDMALIEGGEFTMGRDGGPADEYPPHNVSVKNFYMDKTEVTNAEYFEFIKATGHASPPHWKDNKPLSGQETWPVVFVSLKDVTEFAEWRSRRDEVLYRLPTEDEWEYAARNGADNNMYPWGNDWSDGKAVIEQASVRPVNSIPEGKNKWGIVDLIGNVWEWTSTKASVYPGNDKLEVKSDSQNSFIIRGGSFQDFGKDRPKRPAITSTRRVGYDGDKKENVIGFRLVRSGE